MLSPSSPVEEYPKIGPAYAKRLKKFGVSTLEDLLLYFPQRYDDFSNILTIKSAKRNLGEVVCIQGRISEIESSFTWKRRMSITQMTIQDDEDEIRAVWYNQPYLAKSFKEDDYISLAGKITLSDQEGIFLSNPAYERIYDTGNTDELTHTGRIIPVYAETKGLTSRWLRYIIKPLLFRFAEMLPEILPPEIVSKQKFLSLADAVWQLHFPDSFEAADAAKMRFSFQELFLIQLNVLKEKLKMIRQQAPAFPLDEKLMKDFTDSLSFKLTDAQRKCAFQILKDLEKNYPMSRLLEGDVGSGKTVVGAMAALNVVKHNYQVAFLAPTEILASQHFSSLCNSLKNFDVAIGFMSGKTAKIFRNGESFEVSKKSFLGDLENGQLGIIVGTHALIQKGIQFKQLGLVIVDEQHRFGVKQRAELTRHQKLIPHLLSMTATPIPRTLALTMYGDLELSLIDEMPKNRKKIKTIVVDQAQRKDAYDFIRKEVKMGRGVFVICPKIETKKPDETKPQATTKFVPMNYAFMQNTVNELKAVKDEAERLQKDVFPDLKVGTLHGKMKAKEKEDIMNDFKEGRIDILVSTSVVEVGVDVPRATVMMIEGSERFGLAQLHQFRGRVGRSDMQSYCFLFTTDPSQLNRKRLKAMEQFDSGFQLAQIDLEIRGPGSLFGGQQSGLPDGAMQGLSNIFLVEKTREAAKEILEKDPLLKEYPALKEELKKFQKKIHFE
jgi:ATP-dependent DNA helicase RecG